jgi:hypothetical protein
MRRIDEASWGLERMQRQEALITGKGVPSTRAQYAVQPINWIMRNGLTAKVLLVCRVSASST